MDSLNIGACNCKGANSTSVTIPSWHIYAYGHCGHKARPSTFKTALPNAPARSILCRRLVCSIARLRTYTFASQPAEMKNMLCSTECPSKLRPPPSSHACKHKYSNDKMESATPHLSLQEEQKKDAEQMHAIRLGKRCVNSHRRIVKINAVGAIVDASMCFFLS